MAGGADKATKPADSLPLLRRPRPPPAGHSQLSGKSKHFKGQSLLALEQQSQVASKQPAYQSDSAQSSQTELHHLLAEPIQPPVPVIVQKQDKPVADQFDSIEDMVVYSGDVTVKPKYVAQAKPFPGPDPLPPGRVLVGPPPPLILPDISTSGSVVSLTGSGAGDIHSNGAELHANNTDVSLMEGSANVPIPVVTDTQLGMVFSDARAEVLKPVLSHTMLEKAMTSTMHYKRMPGWKGPAGEAEKQRELHRVEVKRKGKRVLVFVARLLVKH